MIAFTIATDRLVLRPFAAADAPRVRALADAWDVARMLGNVPHPYPAGLAERWIGLHDSRRGSAAGYPFAITRDGEVIGSVGIERVDDQPFELGYWLGAAYWGQGYGREAAQALVAFGFGWLGLAEIVAGHRPENVASQRILDRLGFGVTGEALTWCAAEQRKVPSVRRRLPRDAWMPNRL